ncbi:MAG: hypothetical protein NC929_03080 [Candidatus Omnitrophica bacterium]|nr:hypothetical protein [Candidatus Omnitrophota bacterium]
MVINQIKNSSTLWSFKSKIKYLKNHIKYERPLKREGGSSFDPVMVNSFIECRDEIIRIQKIYREDITDNKMGK